MSTSLLLTELSTVTFIIGSDRSTTVTLNLGNIGAVFAPPLATTYKGTVTWSITTDTKNSILGNDVVISMDNIEVTAYTITYPEAVPGSGSLSGSKISKVTMNNKKPMCVADGDSFSIDIDAYYTDTSGNHYMGPTPCTCEFNAVQTVTSGLISE